MQDLGSPIFSCQEAPDSQFMRCPFLRWFHLRALAPQGEQSGLTCFQGAAYFGWCKQLRYYIKEIMYCKELTLWLPSIFFSINCDEQWAVSPDPTLSSMEQVIDHMERNKLPLHTQDIYNAFLLESANCTSANQHIYNKWSIMISCKIYLIWSKFARKSYPESMKVLKSPECLGHFTVLIKQTFPSCFMAANGAKDRIF